MATNGEFDKLISAALVSRKFRDKLLSEPEAAINDGFHGERFNIPPEMVNMISTINAPTLSDFVQELVLQTNMNGRD